MCNEDKYEELVSAVKDLIRLYRDYLFQPGGGFVASYRIEHWVKLCELVGEPTESQPVIGGEKIG